MSCGRLLLAGVAAVVVAAPAGGAPGAHTFPKLLVRDNGASVAIEIDHGDLDDPAAKLTIYAPAGYTASLSRPAGTRVGFTRALVTAPDLGLAKIAVAGEVVVRTARATYAAGSGPVALDAAAESCTGRAAHAGFWVLVLKGSGQSLELPLFVDAAPAEARFASATIRACLPPPDLPRGDPRRAPLGFELAHATVTLTGIFRAKGAGVRRWRMTETEYAPGGDVPNEPDTSETQALDFPGASVELRRPVVTVRNGMAVVTVRGRSAIPAIAEPAFDLYQGPSRTSLRWSTRLRAKGAILAGTLRVRLARSAATVYLQARGRVEPLGLGASFCRPTFHPAGIPCVYATRTGLVARSSTLAVTLPARR